MSWDVQTLFRSYAKEITRALRRRGLNEETAADITQDTFLRVLATPPPSGAANHNPRAYLHQVSRNLSINHIQRGRRSAVVEIDDDALLQVADPMPSPERILCDRQRLRLVEAALAELPERTRIAFERHRLGEQTIASIGGELGLSTTRTWSLIREAYRHIVLRSGGF
jgi:RNA polymerase sigma-70 factor (ECF subfamily)